MRRDFPGVQIRVSFYDIPLENLPPIFTADILGNEYLITSMGALSTEAALRNQKCYFTFLEVPISYKEVNFLEYADEKKETEINLNWNENTKNA